MSFRLTVVESSLASVGDGQFGKFFEELIEAQTVLKVFAQKGNFVGRNAFATVAFIFPALMFVIGTFSDSSFAAGSGNFTVFFRKGTAFDGSDGGQFGENGLTLILG